MTISNAQSVINKLRTEKFNNFTMRLLERWNALLIELNSLELQSYELHALEQELEIHMHKIEANPTRSNLKSTLSSTLKYLDQNLDVKSGNKVFAFGLMIGLLIGIVAGIGIWMGLLIGAISGFAGLYFIKQNYRTVKTNLEDIW